MEGGKGGVTFGGGDNPYNANNANNPNNLITLITLTPNDPNNPNSPSNMLIAPNNNLASSPIGL
jgi:hypothetical protein